MRALTVLRVWAQKSKMGVLVKCTCHLSFSDSVARFFFQKSVFTIRKNPYKIRTHSTRFVAARSAKVDPFWLSCSWNFYRPMTYQKMLQIKIIQNKISYKKLSGRISLIFPRSGGKGRGLQSLSCLKYYNVLKW